jgi:hypothetical protein
MSTTIPLGPRKQHRKECLKHRKRGYSSQLAGQCTFMCGTITLTQLIPQMKEVLDCSPPGMGLVTLLRVGLQIWREQVLQSRFIEAGISLIAAS